MEIRAHCVYAGAAEGEVVVYNGPFSFLGDIDPQSGTVPVPGHELEGQSLVQKIFVFTTGKGSSGGPRFAWLAKRNGMAPAGIICLECEPVLACGVIAAEIPTVDRPEVDPFSEIRTGDYVKLDATRGIIEVLAR